MAAASLLRIGSIELAGETRDAFGLEEMTGDIGFSIVEGREPVSDSEVLAGAQLLDDLDLDDGDRLDLAVGSPPFTIVGRAVFPPIDDPNSLATTLGFTRGGLAAAFATVATGARRLDTRRRSSGSLQG
jgi:hypothetical protein